MSPPDLQRIPFDPHPDDDAGPYATAAVAIVHATRRKGPNVSFHRCLRLDRTTRKNVERRGTDSA